MQPEGVKRPGELAAFPARSGGRWKAIVIVLVLVAILAMGGVWFWNYSQTYESTDDAQIDAHLNNISSLIEGPIVKVNVDVNQRVKAGDVLAEIEPSYYQAKVTQAQAQHAQKEAEIRVQDPAVQITETSNQSNISETEAEIRTAQAAIAGAEQDAVVNQARLREAQANSAKAQADEARYKALADKDEIPRQVYDQSVATAQALSAAVDSARAAVDASQKLVDQRRAQLSQIESRLNEFTRNGPLQVAASRANVAAKQADARAARAEVETAQIGLFNTKIFTLVGGVVTKRNAELGNVVQPGQMLFQVAQIDDLWVTANFKETQLKRIHPGQKATISVDAFGQDFSGYVESMPAATGGVTSLLPPENASGNFVKVVQRLPMRLRFNKNQPGLDRLRPGMSVEPKIWVK